MSGFSDRLAELVGGDRRKSAFSRETGVPLSSLRDYLKGKEPTIEPLVRIARAKGLSVHWLATGEGQKYYITQINRAAGEPRVNATQSGQSMSPELHFTDSPPDGFVSIPRFDVKASAGFGRVADPDQVDATTAIALRTTWLRALGISPGHAQFLTADGDSMQETIMHGDLLLVNRLMDRVVTNAIYVVVLAGAVMVKRLQLLRDGAIMLISDNPLYQPERVDKTEVNDLQIEGRVQWYGRAI